MEAQLQRQQLSDAGGFIESIAQLASKNKTQGVVQKLRATALEQLREQGIPSTKDEHWKYTNLQTLARSSAKAADGSSVTLEKLQPYLIAGLETHRIVFVNGVYAPELSDLGKPPLGARVTSLREMLAHPDAALQSVLDAQLGKLADSSKHALTALNSALLTDGLLFVVGDNVQMTKPVHAVYVSSTTEDNAVVPIRNLILIGKNAQAKFIESFVGLTSRNYFSNSVTELSCAERSVFEHTKIQQEGPAATHFGVMYIDEESHSSLNSNNFSFGGSLVRNEISPRLNGEHVEALVHGLSALSNAQHVDNTLIIDHAKPNSFSREVFKGIYRDTSSGAFSGTIIVQPDAQKTNAIQSNQSLLLSPDASVDTRPQLKIYADDVKCTHGATVGQLDEDGMFYICSRGIDRETARGMLVHAFASDIINYVTLEPVKAYLENALLKAIRLEA